MASMPLRVNDMCPVYDDEPEVLIGRRPGTKPAMAIGGTRGGSASGLSFDLVWADARSSVATLRLRVAGKPVWGDEDDGVRVELAGLLDHLSASWNALQFEQSYPVGLSATSPSKLASEISRHELGSAAIRKVEAFLKRHDLSTWSSIPKISSLWLLREGNNMLLDIGSSDWRWPVADVMRALTSLGDSIAARLEQEHPGALRVRRWAERDEITDLAAAALATGFSEQSVQRWLDDRVLTTLPGRDVLLQDMSEVMAAARMMGPVAEGGTLVELTRALDNLPARATPALDGLSAAAAVELELALDRPAYAQGHTLAQWLRRQLGFWTEGTSVDLNALLDSWSVDLKPLHLPPSLEAVCVWGRHGPGILLNPQGARNVGGGDRASIAHEVCHLLVDRHRNLPVLDVLKTETRGRLEARANAFAAEFIAPMQWLAAVYKRAPTLQAALAEAMGTYEVTRTLAARQLLNARINYGAFIAEADVVKLEAAVA